MVAGDTVGLAFSPTSRSARVGDIITFDLKVVAGRQPVNNVELYVDFDPAVLKIVNAAGNPVSTIEADPSALTTELYNDVDNAGGPHPLRCRQTQRYAADGHFPARGSALQGAGVGSLNNGAFRVSIGRVLRRRLGCRQPGKRHRQGANAYLDADIYIQTMVADLLAHRAALTV